MCTFKFQLACGFDGFETHRHHFSTLYSLVSTTKWIFFDYFKLGYYLRSLCPPIFFLGPCYSSFIDDGVAFIFFSFFFCIKFLSVPLCCWMYTYTICSLRLATHFIYISSPPLLFPQLSILLSYYPALRITTRPFRRLVIRSTKD